GVKVILLTSGPLGRVDARGGVFSAVLSKPVKQSDLLEAISGVFAPRATKPVRRRVRIPPSPSVRTRPLRILVAEDHAPNQKLVTAILEQRHDTVVIAHNGSEAVERSGHDTFDLILMDVQMPVMSGLEATSAIRARERSSGAHVPIIAMTAHAMTGDRERCLEAGMDGYVSKPLRPDQLLATVDALATSAKPSVEPEVVSGFNRTGEPDVVSAVSRTAADQASLNVDSLLAGFGGNKKVLREVIDMFLVDGPELMS